MKNSIITAGVDEVGRGCLAGPVVSAAVILNEKIELKLIKDSGMVVECTKKFHFLYNGEEVDIIYASIFSKAYSQWKIEI